MTYNTVGRDELQNQLVAIRKRYDDASDRKAITIAPEHGVCYDKIIQIIDRVRNADYPEISIAKLRG